MFLFEGLEEWMLLVCLVWVELRGPIYWPTLANIFQRKKAEQRMVEIIYSTFGSLLF